jgi:hypothetical protein
MELFAQIGKSPVRIKGTLRLPRGSWLQEKAPTPSTGDAKHNRGLTRNQGQGQQCPSSKDSRHLQLQFLCSLQSPAAIHKEALRGTGSSLNLVVGGRFGSAPSSDTQMTKTWQKPNLPTAPVHRSKLWLCRIHLLNPEILVSLFFSVSSTLGLVASLWSYWLLGNPNVAFILFGLFTTSGNNFLY